MSSRKDTIAQLRQINKAAASGKFDSQFKWTTPDAALQLIVDNLKDPDLKTVESLKKEVSNLSENPKNLKEATKVFDSLVGQLPHP